MTESLRERMALTLAIATCVHLLLLVALPPFPSPDVQEEKTVRVILGSPYRAPSLTPSIPAQNTASPPESSQEIARESPEPTAQEKTLSPEIPASAEKSSVTHPANKERRQTSDSETASRPRNPPSQKSAQSSRQGELKAFNEQSEQDIKPRLESTAPQRPELSPYELAIRQAIARELRYTASMAELESPRRLMLEIELMKNGILQRASVIETSGDDRLDYQARQAALVASPFPAVPEEQKERRFTVELRFTPASYSRKGRETPGWSGG